MVESALKDGTAGRPPAAAAAPAPADVAPLATTVPAPQAAAQTAAALAQAPTASTPSMDTGDDFTARLAALRAARENAMGGAAVATTVRLVLGAKELACSAYGWHARTHRAVQPTVGAGHRSLVRANRSPQYLLRLSKPRTWRRALPLATAEPRSPLCASASSVSSVSGWSWPRSAGRPPTEVLFLSVHSAKCHARGLAWGRAWDGHGEGGREGTWRAQMEGAYVGQGVPGQARSTTSHLPYPTACRPDVKAGW